MVQYTTRYIRTQYIKVIMRTNIVPTMLLSLLAVHDCYTTRGYSVHWHFSSLGLTSTAKKAPSGFSRTTTSLPMAIKGPVRYSTNDVFECLASWPSSRILKRIRYTLTLLTFWALALTSVYKVFKLKYVIPGSIHSIAGSALSLLLVFRTNSSYDRFWDGRKQWSSIITACRDIARLTNLHISPTHHSEIAKLLVLFTLTLKQHLQGVKNSSELQPFIAEESLEAVQALKNRPLYILSKIAHKMHISLKDAAGEHEDLFEEHLHTLSACLANCERIVKQPVPLAYSRHTSRFLTIYLLTFPLALLPQMGWSTVLITAAISWSFLSIQEIGHFIEEPFDKDKQMISLPLLISTLRSDISGERSPLYFSLFIDDLFAFHVQSC